VPEILRILMIGDVVGRPGRRAVGEILPRLRERLDLDFVVANGENTAGGAGITPRTFEELVSAGVDVVTTGNHVFRRREILPLLDSAEDRLLRPANFSTRCPGRGLTVRRDRAGREVSVLNLQGRVFMSPSEDPFDVAEAVLEGLRTSVLLVDVHAEATSEKEAMGWFLDGRASVVAGTHTHVPTADARVLPRGTGYVTDLGMTGPHESCLGVETDLILRRYRTGMPVRFDVATGDVRLQGLMAEIDAESGRTVRVERVEERLP
jgi:metallophosphoesterase (TIGR00282 family)